MSKVVLDLWAYYIQFVKDNYPAEYAEMVARAEARRVETAANETELEAEMI